LDGSGALQCNTFLWYGYDDQGNAIAVDVSGNVYVTGTTFSQQGRYKDAFVAKLNGNGALQWGTDLGGIASDFGKAIAVDVSGNVYVTGDSYATWGSPVRPFAGGCDAFVAKLDGSGALQQSTFLGGANDDQGNAIAVDVSGNVYVTGNSNVSWGSPVRAFAGSYDAFVAKIFYSESSTTLTVTYPNGGEILMAGVDDGINWNSTGTIASVNIDYSTNSGGSWTSVAAGTVNDGSYPWTVPAAPSTTCLVRVSDAANATTLDISNAVFTISVPAETVSAPSQPAGADSGLKAINYPFTTGGSTSSLGHAVQYRFDWDDGSDSGWLAQGTTGAFHSWTINDTYDVKAMARCVTHTGVESLWSDSHSIVISDSGSLGYFNSPSNRLYLPEVNWALASTGGTWVSEVQIVDVTGGSVIQVYYNTGTTRLGPFTLWTNSGAACSSITFANVLQTIDGLDGSATVYDGTGGTLEMVTQDSSHIIQAAVRSYNGNYSRTFPALADVETNTAASGRSLVVPNLSNDVNFRPSLVLFNPSASSVTATVQIIGSNGSQVGSTIPKTVAGYEMTGVAGLRVDTYSNADVLVTVTGGSGRLIVSGQSAHNSSTDPAAHIAVQVGSGYVNSPAERLIFPEVNWAAASTGGTWISEVHISDMTGGSVVQAYYNYGTSRRGPFTLWTNAGGAGSNTTFANILQTLQGLDSGFTYNGTGGSLELVTQDGSHLIQAAIRSYNGNVTRTFPALQDVDDTTAAAGRDLMIPNISNDTQYRPSVALFNASSDSVTVEVRIIGSNGSQIGSTISRTLAGYEMAGVAGLRNYTYSNAFIRVTVTGGSGRVIASGQSANNTSNDPAAHIAVQRQ